jgi:ubiquinol-cytochrome c reductase cytochrome b subunit
MAALRLAMEGQEVSRAGGWVARFWKFVDERLGLDALRYEVPAYSNTLTYTLGGITFFSLLIVGLTGIILAQFYNPDPAEANQSVRTIIDTVYAGDFVRNVHYWSAQVIIVSLILHLTRVYLTRAYRKPRELNWIVGVGLLATTIGLYFTGTVLKWDQEAFEALEHTIEMSQLLGPFGSFFSPGFAVGVPLLTRLYSLHVSVLPLVLLGLFVFHVFYVRHFSIASLPKKTRARLVKDPEAVGSFLDHTKKILIYGVVVFFLIAVLALIFPAPLGPQPIEGIEVTKPPWPFLWIFPIESAFGIEWLLPVSAAPLLLLLLVPFLDRGEEPGSRKRLLFVAAFFVAIAVLLALTAIAALMGPAKHLGG